MPKIASKDGTSIAYDKVGNGPVVVLVDGALCYRASGPAKKLADALAPNFTVLTYDRRGRGESSDVLPYAVEREVEDLDALITQAGGGSAYVYGISSGGALALEAANRLTGVKKVAVYEAPFVVDDSHPARPDTYIQTMENLIANGQRSDAVKRFMQTVGVPSAFIALMPLIPAWKKLKGVAHTLPYDFYVLGDTGSGKPLPTERWNNIKVPTIVMDGGKSPQWMRNGMKSLAAVLPNAKYQTLNGQTHMLKASAVAPVLTEFFNQEE